MIQKITPNINNYNTKYNSGNSVKFTNYTISEENNLSSKQKLTIAGSAIAGMAPVIAFWAHKKGFNLNPSKIFKTPVKDWALFKWKKFPNDKSTVEYGWKEILSIATGSILGGFIGGSIVDKQNRKSKKREFLNQLLGNVLVPVSCVGAGSQLYSKYADKIEGAMPQIKSNKKLAKVFNTVTQKLPNAATTLGLLGVGIYLGNKVSNLINDKLYNKKVDRNIRPTDFAPHVDDVCMSVSMMNEHSTFGSKLGRVIPFALIVPGYETGIAQG